MDRIRMAAVAAVLAAGLAVGGCEVGDVTVGQLDKTDSGDKTSYQDSDGNGTVSTVESNAASAKEGGAE